MNPHAIEDFRKAETLKFLSNLNQIKLPGLRPSMSRDDLVNHIGHCISEQMGPDSSNFADRSMLEEFTQYLFADSQLMQASDEPYVMSRVNSLYCLLQKDPSTTEDKTVHNTDDDRKVDASNNSTRCETKMVDLESEQRDDDDDSGNQQEIGLSRKESAGELLMNLPRIASMPHFLFPMSEDSGRQVR